jgi:hypothetical protein
VKRALLLTLAFASGCWNFQNDLSTCADAGGCRGEARSDGGTSSDAGTTDAGATFTRFKTRSGWSWEYPLPAGGALPALLPIDADELWAAGTDGVLLHLLDGGWDVTHVSTERPTDEALLNSCLLALPDGGVFMMNGDTYFLGALPQPTSYLKPPPLNLSTCAMRPDGLVFVGAQQQGGTLCPDVSAAIYELRDDVLELKFCEERGDSFVRAIDPEYGRAFVSGYENGQPEAHLLSRDPAMWSRGPSFDDAGAYPGGGLVGISDMKTWIFGAYGDAYEFDTLAAPTRISSGLVTSWDTALRLSATEVLVAGTDGVVRCTIATRQCVTELAKRLPNASMARRGDVVLVSSGVGALYRRDAAGRWTQLLTGAEQQLDVFRAADGSWWALGDDGAISHSDGAKWTTTPVPGVPRALTGITELDDGHVLIVGADALLRGPTWASTNFVRLDGGGEGPLTSSDGRDFFAISGHAPNQVWAVGAHTLAVWTGARFEERALPRDTVLRDVWVTSNGVAWAVGDGAVFFFDGTRWTDLLGPMMGSVVSIAGVGPNEIYAVDGTADLLHITSDGGLTRESLGQGQEFTAVAVRPLEDGGLAIYAADRERIVGRDSRGQDLRLPLLGNGAVRRLRVIDGKLWATGADVNGPGFVLSIDAP